jgi:hypothetical protein
MKSLALLLLALMVVGCHQSNVSPAFRSDAIEFGSFWMRAFEALGESGLENPKFIKGVRAEIQPVLDRLKSTSGDEKKIYEEALFLDRALGYLSENAAKPVGERFPDPQLNKILGIKDGKLPEDPSLLAQAFGDLLVRYMALCR